MSTFRVQPLDTDTTVFKNSLLSDPRLSAEALGVLCFLLYSGAKVNYEESIDVVFGLIREWNEERPKEKHLSQDKLRRLVNEWQAAGYVSSYLTKDVEGVLLGKGLTIHQESSTTARQSVRSVPPSSTAPIPLTSAGKSTGKKHSFPAAQIFQEHFSVDLDLDTMHYIQNETGQDLKRWGRVCADHYNSLTEQQKDSVIYRTKAIKFCLGDFRMLVERDAFRATKTPYGKPDEELPDKPKKKVFADYIESGEYVVGSEKYETFKANWLRIATENGNAAAIEQVEEYEGLKRSLADIKARKGGVQK